MPIRKLIIKLARLLPFFFASWFVSLPALSASFLLIPIESILVQGEAPVASYDLPCGAESVGALVRTNASRDTLSMAMVVRVSKILCTALPARVTAPLDYVSTQGFAKVQPLVLSAPVRISPLPVSGLRMSRSGAHIEAVYESGCGKLAGTILRRGSEQTVEVAMAEMTGTGGSASTAGKKCAAGSITATVPGALIAEGRKFRPYEVTPSDIERAFFVRLASVKAESLKRGADGIAVSYYRKCNEAPIGVVVEGHTTKNKLQRATSASGVRVGVLVARYYNLVCPDHAAAEVEDRIRNQDISIPTSTVVTFMAPTRKASTLTIREPSQYAVLKKATGRGFAIDFKTSCNRQLGAIYTRDVKGHLAVGVLERQGDPFQCKAGRDLTLFQPFAGKGPGVTAIYPLKIRRNSAS